MIHTIKSFFQKNKFRYLALFILLMAGFIVGSVYSNAIGAEEFSDSVASAQAFIKASKERSLSFDALIAEEANPVLLILVSGLFLFGFVPALFFVFKSGFSTGFFLSFLVKAFSLKGFFLGCFFLLSDFIFLFPAIMISAYRALRINCFVLGALKSRHPSRTGFKGELVALVGTACAAILLTLAEATVKFFLLPALTGYLFV